MVAFKLRLPLVEGSDSDFPPLTACNWSLLFRLDIASSLSQGVIFRPRAFEKWEWHNGAQAQGNDY